MANEILCPSCHHSLGFHPYDDSDDGCQAPIGGLTSHDKCGCPMTIHIFIQGLQKAISSEEIKNLKTQNETYSKELAIRHTLMARARKELNFLSSTLADVKVILNEVKLIEPRLVDGWFVMDYKRKIHELLDKALERMEKRNG